MASHTHRIATIKFGVVALILAVLIGGFSGCSRDPKVRRQKYLESGKRYYDQGKYREASIQFMNALRIDPRFADAHYELALAYGKLGAWNGAYAELMRTIDLQPGNLSAQLQLGNLLLAGGEVAKAKEKANLVIQANPSDPMGHALLANAQAAAGDKDGAMREIAAAISFAPKNSDLYLNQATLLVNVGRFADAEASYKKGIDLNPKAAMPVLALARFYQHQGRNGEAEQQYRRAIELDSKDIQARVALARFYVSQHEPAKAQQAMAEAKRVFSEVPEGYRLLAEFYLGTGEIAKATDELANLNREHPKDVIVRGAYVQVLLLQNKIEEATRINDQVLKSNPKDIDALIARGDILNRSGKSTDAVTILQQAVKADANNANAHYQLGIAYARTGDAARAETEWRDTIRLSPTFLDAYKMLAAPALQKGDMDLLGRVSDQLIRLAPRAPEGYIYRAMVAAKNKQSKAVEADLNKAVQLAPNHPLPYTKVAEWSLMQKRYGDAEKQFETALQKDPSYSPALRGLVTVYESQKQPKKALGRVQAQITKVPDSSSFYVLLGDVQFGATDYDAAEASFQKALQLDANHKEARLRLANLELGRGFLDKAAANYEFLTKSDPNNATPYVLLAGVEELRSNWQRAQELYERALQIRPDEPVASNNLAYLLLQHGGNVDVALSLAQTARRGMPKSPTSADTLAWAYYHKGVYGTAASLLEEAVRQSPENQAVHYHLGLTYHQLKRSNDAKSQLKRALDINPNSAEAPAIRKALDEVKG